MIVTISRYSVISSCWKEVNVTGYIFQSVKGYVGITISPTYAYFIHVVNYS